MSRIVVKLGTSTLTAGGPTLSKPRMVELVRQMAELRAAGHEVVLVSSGAIAAGRAALGFPTVPRHVPHKQMLAAVGQPRLAALYERLFGLYGITAAQVLLTRADLDDRSRYLNSRNTLHALLAHGVLPIVNENDTVATEEIRVGDNDNLSALVASLVDAQLLVMLTDQAGLFTADPRHDPDARLIEEVTEPVLGEQLWRAASNGPGTGGMTTKLQAAEIARRSGCTVVIAAGGESDALTRLADGERLGTRILPTGSRLESRKRYILAGGRVRGTIHVDEGAARALLAGRSLLPAGVSRVEGTFARGETVRVLDPGGRELARGVTSYANADLERIRGRRTEEIGAVLGFDHGGEVVHRNDLVLMTETAGA